MESFDADCYVVEYMIRDRLINAQATARAAALLAEANVSPGPNAIKTRFTDLGRALMKGVRKVVGEMSHALPGRTGVKEEAQ